MVDWQFYGPNPMGHHLTNLILHAINSALLFVLLFQMTRATWRSAFVAALFAWHPLHVESVAWAAERKDVLCALFWILTLMAYTKYVRQKAAVSEPQKNPNLYYALSLALFALALMSKPMAVTIPCVLLLLDFWPLARFPVFSTGAAPGAGSDAAARQQNIKTLILEKLPFFAFAIMASIVTFTVQQAGGAVHSLQSASFALRFENAFLAYLRYLGKTIWPVDLAVLYPLSSHLPMIAVASAVVVFVLICAAAFWL